jgi:malate dehydrogenase (oxaloacetate-decarboxylating)(NADP+)
MKVAASRALAALAKEPVPEVVLKAYELDRLGFGPDYLIPKPFDPRVLWTVAPAVAATATAEGLARVPLADPVAYGEELRARFSASYGLVQAITARARIRPLRVVYPYGNDLRILRAARRVKDEGIASPVLLGDVGLTREMAAEAGITLDGIEVIDPRAQTATLDRYAIVYEQLRRHKGMTAEQARTRVVDHATFAALMVREGAADAVLGGLSTFYPETIRPALQVLPMEAGRTIVSCAVNIQPNSEQLAEIALAAVEVAERQFNRRPRVAFISYSDFGSAGGEEPERVRKAVDIFHTMRPDVPVDGEMQADTAVMPDLLADRRPGGPLDRAANVLVFPNLSAANASYKLLNRLGGADVIGPILSGLSKPVHVLQRDAGVGDVVNLTAIAVADAQRKVPGV